MIAHISKLCFSIFLEKINVLDYLVYVAYRQDVIKIKRLYIWSFAISVEILLQILNVKTLQDLLKTFTSVYFKS